MIDKVDQGLKKILDEAAQLGYEKALKDFKALVKEWKDAYPIDIFTEVDPVFSKAITCQDQYDTLITRCSAAMGRHISSRLLDQLDELMMHEVEGE